jgi:transcription antitermination factor NusG
MGRVNKLTEGVFADMVGTSKQINKYTEFLNNVDAKSKNLKTLRKDYENMTGSNKDLFNKLAKLEEVILQIRAKEAMMTGHTGEIKLSLVREYLYARYPFYRKGMTTKDIRVIVDKSEFWGEDLNILVKNKEFMTKAVEKLSKAMDVEIDSNYFEYKNLN